MSTHNSLTQFMIARCGQFQMTNLSTKTYIFSLPLRSFCGKVHFVQQKDFPLLNFCYHYTLKIILIFFQREIFILFDTATVSNTQLSTLVFNTTLFGQRTGLTVVIRTKYFLDHHTINTDSQYKNQRETKKCKYPNITHIFSFKNTD